MATASVLFAQNTGSVVKLENAGTYEKVKLRGYGVISGTYWKASVAGGVMEVVCDDEEKAKLLQAKYLSDVQLLPRVKKSTVDSPAGKAEAVEVEEQGTVAALRTGSKVWLIGAATQADLSKLISEVSQKSGATFTSTADVEVPMWLDRWDKYAFRFYYRVWERPPGEKNETYNVFEEFEYAEKAEKSGFVFWSNPDPMDTAEGLGNDPFWGWARDAAVAKKLPMALNIMAGSQGSTWLNNRFREQNAQKAPQFCGNYHRVADFSLGSQGSLSWSSTTAKDEGLAINQQSVREACKYPNLTTILEPHGELRHGEQDIFMEYGPVADATYREYLKEKYKTVDAVAKSWGVKLSSWSDIRVPEAASFLGWSDKALDLSGEWKIEYEKFADGKNYDQKELFVMHNLFVATEPLPEDRFSEKFDDSSWPSIVAPGHDRQMFLQWRPAILRRTVNVPKEWLDKNSHVWIYLWDLNRGPRNEVKVAVNGKIVGTTLVKEPAPHWSAHEVSKVIRPGQNQITLRLPKGIIGYRVYLSPDAPKQYPDLGEGKNNQWVDFVDWIGWTRIHTAMRGMEMIRQVEPNRQIDLMAPGFYADGIKQLAVKFGGNFKNTGYMGAFWADDLPALMRGARFPFSLEPSAPAKDLDGFKKQMGLYATEGIHAIDYFIHIGSILWKSDIKEHFEKTLPLIKMIGKCHAPKAEVAALYSTRGNALTGYPWGQNLDVNLPSGYYSWNVRGALLMEYESDALTESSFGNGDADYYKVVIDTNTSIIDDDLLNDIEKYVRNGGTFVTFAQTGRHSPSKKDAWPISRLTGYEVTKIDKLSSSGEKIEESRQLRPAPEQTIFSGDWSKVPANGMSLKKVASDAKDLMLWEDGSVAIGMRQIGKGYIIQIGSKFHGRKIPDRYENGFKEADLAMVEMFKSIIRWRGAEPIGAKLEKDDPRIFFRHYVSNNGLYDVWTIRNRSDKNGVEASLKLPTGIKANWAWDVLEKKTIPLADGKISVKLDAALYKMFLTPRGNVGASFVDWFELQRNWWRGTDEPTGGKLPEVPHKFSVDLSEEWKFKPLQVGEDISKLIGAGVDDATWASMGLMTWTGNPQFRNVKRAILRKTFTVPASWTTGTPSLWISSWIKPDFFDKANIWLDGEQIAKDATEGPMDINPNGTLKAGTTHTLTIEIAGNGYLVGTRSNAWLWYWPKPLQSTDIGGDWTASQDALRYDTKVKVPGALKACGFRRNILIPADQSTNNVVVEFNGEGPLMGVLINGRYIRRLHHLMGDHFQINITPWVRFGQENELEIIVRSQSGGTAPLQVKVKSLNLNFYKKDIYP